MSILSGLGGVGEERILLEARVIIANSQKASRLLGTAAEGAPGLDEMHALKTKSYEEVLRLSNSVTSGAVAPNLIPDMLRLFGLEYKIVDMLFVLARSQTRYKLRNAAARRYVAGRIAATNGLAVQALASIYTMHTEDRLERVKRLRNGVRLIEEEGDEIKEALLSYAYNSRQDFKAFYHIIDLAYLADDVLDSCEDAADMLMSIMLSVST